eukprot:Gb_15222 [translate_table: standard]
MGAAMILYSVWMLNQWHSHVHPPPHAPSPSNPLTEFVIGTDASPGLIQHGQLDVPVSNLETTMNANCVQFLKLGMDFPYHDLPAPWVSVALPVEVVGLHRNYNHDHWLLHTTLSSPCHPCSTTLKLNQPNHSASFC